MIFHFAPPIVVKCELFSNAILFTLKYQIKNKLQKEILPNNLKLIFDNLLIVNG